MKKKSVKRVITHPKTARISTRSKIVITHLLLVSTLQVRQRLLMPNPAVVSIGEASYAINTLSVLLCALKDRLVASEHTIG
jgi:hypothetical protein